MTRSRGRAAALLLAAFVAGILTGAAALAYADRHDLWEGGRRRSYVERLTEELELTPVQRDSVQAVLDRYRPRTDSVWQEVAPRLETLRGAVRSEIRAQLTPEQQEQYDAMVQRHHRRSRGRSDADR